jgi:hypothetical protein
VDLKKPKKHGALKEQKTYPKLPKLAIAFGVFFHESMY